MKNIANEIGLIESCFSGHHQNEEYQKIHTTVLNDLFFTIKYLTGQIHQLTKRPFAGDSPISAVEFLIQNGYKTDILEDGYISFIKNDNLLRIDLNDQEIVLVNESGNTLHLPNNVFALLGALLHYRRIDFNYQFQLQ